MKPHPEYNRQYRGAKLDPYRVILIYEIEHPAHQHALKKLLRAGRSHKQLHQDIDEVIETLQRWKEMIEEDLPTVEDVQKIYREAQSKPDWLSEDSTTKEGR